MSLSEFMIIVREAADAIMNITTIDIDFSIEREEGVTIIMEQKTVPYRLIISEE